LTTTDKGVTKMAAANAKQAAKEAAMANKPLRSKDLGNETGDFSDDEGDEDEDEDIDCGGPSHGLVPWDDALRSWKTLVDCGSVDDTSLLESDVLVLACFELADACESAGMFGHMPTPPHARPSTSSVITSCVSLPTHSCHP